MSSSALERHVGRGSSESWTFLQVAFDRFASPEFDFFRVRKIDLVEVESLKRTAAKIKPLYDEAEVKQFNDGDMKWWLNQLKELLCDAGDIIDEYATELLRLKWIYEPQLHLDHQIQKEGIENLGSKVRDIKKRFKIKALEGIFLGLTSTMGSPSSRPPMNSLLDRSDMEKIVEFLLSDEIMVSPILRRFTEKNVLQIIAGSRGLSDPLEGPSPLAGSSSVLGKPPEDPETNLMISKIGHCSPDFLLDQLDVDSPIFRGICDVLRNPEEMGLGDMTPTSSQLLQVLQRLKLSLRGLRDAELQKLGVPAKQECLDHQPLFEGLGHVLEHIDSFVSGQTPLRRRPPQAQRTEAVDIISLIHDNSVALRNIASELETIGELVRSQIRELEMPEEPHDPLPLVQSYHETVQSKPGKEQHSSMEIKINKGSTSKVSSSKVCENFQNLPEDLKKCVFYTSTLFPGDYEFEEDTLIQLWIAAGFIQTELEQLVERGQIYFEELHKLSIFQMSSPVRKNYDPTYRVHKDVYKLKQEGFPDEYTTMDEGGPAEISPTTLHSTLLLGGNGTDFDSKIFERFYKAESLNTFKLQIEYGSPIKHVPHIFFVKLRFLLVLDLSSTEIKELPSSVYNLTHLRYLDVSGTLIKKLPESISELYDLQTLKLRDCSNLVGLPKGMSKLINLQHLDLDGLYQLTSMPPRMGQLTNLQKLSIFVVGREQGFRIEELKCMKKLRGSLCLAKMENVTKDQASVAELGDKVAIHSLEFKWSSSQSKDGTKFNLIEPHSSIKHLKITRYGATSFPKWFSGEKFASLAILHLSYCSCTHLPAPGELRSLQSLCINQMHSLQKISHEFYSSRAPYEVAFSKLELLEIDGMPCLEEWEAMQECDMPKLCQLSIIDCPRLVTVPKFMNLESLQHLRIILCPQIQFCPGERLPESLRSLTITECVKLKEQCQKKDSDERYKITGIPEIWIDYEQKPEISVPVNLESMRSASGVFELNRESDVRLLPLPMRDGDECCKITGNSAILIDHEEEPGIQKEGLKLDLHDDKDGQKAMKAVSTLSGTDLMSMDMKENKFTKVVLKLDLHDDRVRHEAVKAVCGLPEVDSIALNMEEKKMTVNGDVDPVVIIAKLRKLCRTELESVWPPKKKGLKPNLQQKNHLLADIFRNTVSRVCSAWARHDCQSPKCSSSSAGPMPSRLETMLFELFPVTEDVDSNLHDGKDKQKAIKAVATLSGVDSNLHDRKDKQKAIKAVATLSGEAGSPKLQHSMDDDELDARADDFINKFKEQLKLQRLDSIIRYKDMLNRGAS